MDSRGIQPSGSFSADKPLGWAVGFFFATWNLAWNFGRWLLVYQVLMIEGPTQFQVKANTATLCVRPSWYEPLM